MAVVYQLFPRTNNPHSMRYNIFFIKLSIALVYCIAVNDLIYTSQYQYIFKQIAEEYNRDYYKIVNKHLIAIGGKNPAKQKALTHFKEHIVPKLFMQCADGYYSVLEETKSQYIAPSIDKWYEVLYKTGSYKYSSIHRVYGMSELSYRQEIAEQSDSDISVKIELLGKSILKNDWYLLGAFYVLLDYSFAVKKVEGGSGADAFPIYGKGKSPHRFRCEYLQANNGFVVE